MASTLLAETLLVGATKDGADTLYSIKEILSMAQTKKSQTTTGQKMKSDGLSDRVTTLRSVMPSACVPAFAMRTGSHQITQEEKNADSHEGRR